MRGIPAIAALTISAVVAASGCVSESADREGQPTSAEASAREGEPSAESPSPPSEPSSPSSPPEKSAGPAANEAAWAFRAIPAEGATVPMDDAGFTFGVFDVPAGTIGTISLEVTSHERPGDEMSGNASVISVMAFVDGRHRMGVRAFSSGERAVWLAAGARGIPVDRSVDAAVLEGGSTVRVRVDLPEFLEPWGDLNATRRFTMLGITSDDIGTSIHRLDREGAENVTVRFVRGEGARALLTRDFDADGAGAQASAGLLVGAQAGVELVHEVATPCGLTGLFAAPAGLGAHRTDIGYRNDLGETDEFRSVAVGPFHAQDDDPTRGLRLMSFSSPAASWTFFVRTVASGGLDVGEGPIYAPVTQQGVEATPEECGVRPAMT